VSGRARRNDVLLIVRTPPPYAGGEMVGALLEQHFRDRCRVLAFRRPRHHRAAQGKVSRANVVFAIRFVATSAFAILRTRPRVLYVDLPKDAKSFMRNSLILLVALALRTRVVGDLAGGDFQFLSRPGWVAAYGRFLLRRVAVIRVLGTGVAETLQAHGLANARVLSNGIEEPPGAIVERRFPDEPAFLYVGKLAEAKGVPTLVELMARLAAREEPGRLHLVGEWENAEFAARMTSTIEKAGVSDRITLHGLRVDDEKWHLFRSCDLLLHPTHWDGQPVTILEAFAFGLPVVATRIGAIPDTIDDGVDGRLMADTSVEELAGCVSAILAGPETYERYSRNARAAFVGRFSAERFVENMVDLLEGG
jgi:glycosyltransferase involved in cell wall biosynthesis